MKRFNLDEYLKNPARKVVTGDGRNVRIICTDAKSSRTHTVVTLVKESNGSESIVSYTPDGQFLAFIGSETDDLFFATKKCEGWVNVFSGAAGCYSSARIYPTKEEAEKVGKGCDGYIATNSVNWEE